MKLLLILCFFCCSCYADISIQPFPLPNGVAFIEWSIQGSDVADDGTLYYVANQQGIIPVNGVAVISSAGFLDPNKVDYAGGMWAVDSNYAVLQYYSFDLFTVPDNMAYLAGSSRVPVGPLGFVMPTASSSGSSSGVSAADITAIRAVLEVSPGWSPFFQGMAAASPFIVFYIIRRSMRSAASLDC